MSWKSVTQSHKTDSVMENGIHACGCQGPEKDKRARSVRLEGPPCGSFRPKSCYQNGRGSPKNPTSRLCAPLTRPRWKMTVDFKMVLVLITFCWLSFLKGFESKSCTDHKKIFTTMTGMITDGPGFYADLIRCEWLIRGKKHRVCLGSGYDDNVCVGWKTSLQGMAVLDLVPADQCSSGVLMCNIIDSFVFKVMNK